MKRVMLTSLCVAVALVAAPVGAHAENLVSSASNSLCISPPALAPVVGGNINYGPITASHAGPLPDTGAACTHPAIKHPLANSLPGSGCCFHLGYLPESGSPFAPASWVSPFVEGNDWENRPPAYYIYDDRFASCRPAKLEGEMYADNVVGAFLNGNPIGHDLLEETKRNFQDGAVKFGTSNTAYFYSGMNTLQFVVLDTSEPKQGLDFSASVTPTEVCTGEESEAKKIAEAELEKEAKEKSGEAEEIKERGELESGNPEEGGGKGKDETAPHWLSDGKLIKPGPKPVEVSTSGKLTLALSDGKSVTCSVTDKETIENPTSGGPGTDEMTEFKLSSCKGEICAKGEKLEVLASAIPWATELSGGTPITDKIKHLELKIECSKKKVKKTVDVLTGTLEAEVGESVLEFGSGSGQLGESTGSGHASVGGSDQLKGPKGDTTITAADTAT